MASIININRLTSNYNLVLDSEEISIRLYYSRHADRWLLDISNRRLNTSSLGIVVNTGTDLLTGSGRLGLQALVAVSFPDFGNEATIENFAVNVQLVYMTLKEYDQFRFGGLGSVRTQWIEDRELSLDDIRDIIGADPNAPELDPALFVKKPSTFTSGNIIEFDINGNALDSGSSIADLLALVPVVDVRGTAIAMALALGD